MDLEEIRNLIQQGQYEYSLHAQLERLEENLDTVEIEGVILGQSEMLEEYPRDPRGESCLVLGFVGTEPVHIVLGWAKRKPGDEQTLRVITVYRPSTPKWTDPRTRGGTP